MFQTASWKPPQELRSHLALTSSPWLWLVQAILQSFAAPQPSFCDSFSSPTSRCLDTKQGSQERSAECQSEEHDHHCDFHKGDFHVSFGFVRANQRFFYFTDGIRLLPPASEPHLKVEDFSDTSSRRSRATSFHRSNTGAFVVQSFARRHAFRALITHSNASTVALERHCASIADHIGTQFSSARKRTSVRASGAECSLAHFATALSLDGVSDWRKGAHPGTRPSGIFSYRRRKPVAVPPRNCAKQESAANGSEETNIRSQIALL